VDPNTKVDETITAGQKITLKTALPGHQPTAHLWALGGKEPIKSEAAIPDTNGVGTFQPNSLQGSIPAGTT
jgi:hypothetical protein